MTIFFKSGKNDKQNVNKARRARFEALEDRQMLSVTDAAAIVALDS